MLFGRTLGAIYLTTSDGRPRFKEDHLHSWPSFRESPPSRWRTPGTSSGSRAKNALRADSHSITTWSAGGRACGDLRIHREGRADGLDVLIRGESGTGKEWPRAPSTATARAAPNRLSRSTARRSTRRCSKASCSATSAARLRAVALKHGRLEIADGGTVFLDEIGEMPPPMQAKLLRVLQEREFERVGGTRPIKVDVRVIAATNRNLEDAMRDGQFRQDLFYRLDVVSFEMPPLRERREDIPALAAYFVEKYAAKFNRKVSGLTVEAGGCLMNYDWPGNIRELENTIERAVVLGMTAMILPEDLPEMIAEAEPRRANTSERPPVTKYHEAMREAKNNSPQGRRGGERQLHEAAKLLGVNPNYLHRLMRNLNLKGVIKKGER